VAPFLLSSTSHSREETFRIASALGRSLAGSPATQPGGAWVVALTGELGSGKTTFTKGLAQGLGCEPDRVQSPTFVLRQEYRGRLPLKHYDAYRLSGSQELLALGFEEDLDSTGVVVVEWADRVLEAVPLAALRIELEHVGAASHLPGTCPADSGRRRITFRGDPLLWEETVRKAVAGAG